VSPRVVQAFKDAPPLVDPEPIMVTPDDSTVSASGCVHDDGDDECGDGTGPAQCDDGLGVHRSIDTGSSDFSGSQPAAVATYHRLTLESLSGVAEVPVTAVHAAAAVPLERVALRQHRTRYAESRDLFRHTKFDRRFVHNLPSPLMTSPAMCGAVKEVMLVALSPKSAPRSAPSSRSPSRAGSARQRLASPLSPQSPLSRHSDAASAAVTPPHDADTRADSGASDCTYPGAGGGASPGGTSAVWGTVPVPSPVSVAVSLPSPGRRGLRATVEALRRGVGEQLQHSPLQRSTLLITVAAPSRFHAQATTNADVGTVASPEAAKCDDDDDVAARGVVSHVHFAALASPFSAELPDGDDSMATSAKPHGSVRARHTPVSPLVGTAAGDTGTPLRRAASASTRASAAGESAQRGRPPTAVPPVAPYEHTPSSVSDGGDFSHLEGGLDSEVLSTELPAHMRDEQHHNNNNNNNNNNRDGRSRSSSSSDGSSSNGGNTDQHGNGRHAGSDAKCSTCVSAAVLRRWGCCCVDLSVSFVCVACAARVLSCLWQRCEWHAVRDAL
jgi:hypothetical protein